MNKLKEETVATYDNSAKELAKYFVGIGARTKDIDLAFELAGYPENAHVVEIGCGDGRDAEEIVKRADKYLGMDISEGMLGIAREKLPDRTFVQADIADFVFPKDIDIIFSFASLLHSAKDEVADVLERAHKALRPGGVFFISLKHMPEYTEKVKEDAFGRRLFYFYHPELIQELADEKYQVVGKDFQRIGQTDWFTIALKKA